MEGGVFPACSGCKDCVASSKSIKAAVRAERSIAQSAGKGRGSTEWDLVL